MRVYADSAAYVAYTGQAAPANVDTLLRAASRIVDVLARGLVYDTDPSGMPTDADVAQALSDAVCAIAQASPAQLVGTASTATWDSVSIGSVSLSGRSDNTSAVTVAGVPVPLAALAALDTIGTRVVIVR